MPDRNHEPLHLTDHKEGQRDLPPDWDLYNEYADSNQSQANQYQGDAQRRQKHQSKDADDQAADVDDEGYAHGYRGEFR